MGGNLILTQKNEECTGSQLIVTDSGYYNENEDGGSKSSVGQHGGFSRPNESPSFTSLTFAPGWLPLLHIGAFLRYPADLMEMWKVLTLVKKVRNESEDLVVPVQKAATTLDLDTRVPVVHLKGNSP